MILKPKKDYDREQQKLRIPLPHNSLFVLGQEANRSFTHAIKQDRRSLSEKSIEELAYGGNRVSLTFRNVGTFLTPSGRLYGQGARCKTKEDLALFPVIDSDDYRAKEADRMIERFGVENRSCFFDWEELYGAGFDVLCSRSGAADTPAEVEVQVHQPEETNTGCI